MYLKTLQMAFTYNAKCTICSNFGHTTPATKRRRILEGTSGKLSQSDFFLPSPPSKEKLSNFVKELSKTGKHALLSVLPGHCEEYIVDHTLLSLPLSSLYESDAMDLPYQYLLKKCDSVFSNLKVTDDQARTIEISTRDQAQSKTWFCFRAGRITAAKLKAATHTDLSKPSQSLLKSICYPESSKFSTKATKWGCDHEKKASEAYFNEVF